MSAKHQLGSTAGYAILVWLGLLSVPAQAGTYLSLRAGTLSGDYGTTVDSRLDSLTATLSWQGKTLDASFSGRLLHYEADGTTETGVGDIIVRGGKLFPGDTTRDIEFYTSVAGKIPIADENKGLGTGEPDYSVYLSAEKYIGQMKWDIHGSYTFVGDPPGIDYDNQIGYGIGLFRGFVNSGLFASLESGNTSGSLGEGESIAEVHLGFMRWMGLNDLVGASGFVGFTDASADYGINLEWIHSFE